MTAGVERQSPTLTQPTGTERTVTRKRGIPGLLLVALVPVGTVVQLLRQDGIPAYDTVWAEDGGLFLAGALSDPLGSIVDPYTGYLHVVPRLVALVVAAVPLEAAAFVFAAGSAAIVALLAAYVYVASQAVTPSRWVRAGLGAIMVLVPGAAYETANNATNLHWYFLYAAVWAIGHRSATRSQSLARTTVLVGAALSDPMAVFLVPLAVWAWRRDPPDVSRWPLMAFGVALAIQLAAVASALLFGAGTEIPTGEFVLVDATLLFGLRVGGTFLVGNAALNEVWNALGWAASYLSLALVVLLVIYASSRRGVRTGAILPALAVLPVVAFIVPLSLRGTSVIPALPGEVGFIELRWTVAPVMALEAILLLVLRPDPRLPRGMWRGVQAVVLGGLLLQVAANYRVTNYRSDGPSWSDEVAAAREACSEGALGVRLGLSPRLPPGGFQLQLPCEELA